MRLEKNNTVMNINTPDCGFLSVQKYDEAHFLKTAVRVFPIGGDTAGANVMVREASPCFF
jgi:hypothetical protein